MNSYETLELNQLGEVLQIFLNRPSKLNALNQKMMDELALCLNHAITDNSLRGILLSGMGDKAFAAGADIVEFQHMNPSEAKKMSRKGHEEVFNCIENFPKPILAAINGYALGGGLELAMACHLRFASTNAKLGLPELSLGLIPGYGGTQRLSKLVGKGKAMELILSGIQLDADEAQRLGLVNQVYLQEHLISQSLKWLSTTIKKSKFALAAAIKAINASDNELGNGFEIEIDEFSSLFKQSDLKEGISAFLEKREANFIGK